MDSELANKLYERWKKYKSGDACRYVPAQQGAVTAPQPSMLQTVRDWPSWQASDALAARHSGSSSAVPRPVAHQLLRLFSFLYYFWVYACVHAECEGLSLLTPLYLYKHIIR